MAELKGLRQRRDELEARMSALQESRRELVVQLEGLMKLLKVSFIFWFNALCPGSSAALYVPVPQTHSAQHVFQMVLIQKFLI